MFATAIAQCVATLAVLTYEANALSAKGMCQDDFEFYAERLTETEHHLAYLRHLAGVEAAAVAAEEAAWDAEAQAETAAYKEPASCAYCCCLLPGYADGTTRWCSEACWELATAPGYYNAATERVTGEGYADTEPDRTTPEAQAALRRLEARYEALAAGGDDEDAAPF